MLDIRTHFDLIHSIDRKKNHENKGNNVQEILMLKHKSTQLKSKRMVNSLDKFKVLWIAKSKLKCSTPLKTFC